MTGPCSIIKSQLGGQGQPEPEYFALRQVSSPFAILDWGIKIRGG